MATVYNKRTDNADDDLEFKLRRSLQLVKERKEQMTKKKVAETTERASVSRERRLALALRAVLDEVADVEALDVHHSASSVLIDLGYGGLEGIPKQVAALTAELKTATEAGEWARVAALGQQLERVKAGKSLKSVVQSVAKLSSRKSGAAAATQNTKTETEGAGAAIAGGE